MTDLTGFFLEEKRTQYLLYIYNNQSEILWSAKISRDTGMNIQTIKRYNNQLCPDILEKGEPTKVEFEDRKNKSVQPLKLTENGKMIAQSLDMAWKKCEEVGNQ